MKKMLKNSLFKTLIVSTITLVFLNGCSTETGEETCVDSNTCVSNSSPDVNVGTLEVVGVVSEYYNPNTDRWVNFDISENDTSLGILPIFSDSYNLNLEQALDVVSKSSDQKLSPENYQVSDFNTIPYFKFKNDPRFDYLVSYKKYGNLNRLLEETTFQASTIGEYSYIPIVNEQFKGKIQGTSTSDTPSTSFEHVITIVPISGSTVAQSSAKNIRFRLSPQTKLSGIKIVASQESETFNLKSRWDHYYKETDGVPNDDFDIFYLTSQDEGEQATSYDLRVVFKETPTIDLIQHTFVEEVIDLDRYRTTGEVVIQRGESFFEKISTVNSSQHFKKKIKLNGVATDLIDGKEAIRRNLPANETFNIGVVADFNKNANFPINNNLLFPLRPVCSILNSTVFYPVAEKKAMENFRNGGGKGFYCHPDQHIKLLVTPDQVDTSPFANDPYQWFDFFFVRQNSPARTEGNIRRVDAGSFYGIGKLEISFNACIKIYTREAIDSEVNPVEWQKISNEDSECADGTGDGWALINYSISDDIFNYRSSMTGRSDIVNLIENYTTKTKKESPHWYFNGNVDSLKIY